MKCTSLKSSFYHVQNGWAFKMVVVSTGCVITVDHAFNSIYIFIPKIGKWVNSRLAYVKSFSCESSNRQREGQMRPDRLNCEMQDVNLMVDP